MLSKKGECRGDTGQESYRGTRPPPSDMRGRGCIFNRVENAGTRIPHTLAHSTSSTTHQLFSIPMRLYHRFLRTVTTPKTSKSLSLLLIFCFHSHPANQPGKFSTANMASLETVRIAALDGLAFGRHVLPNHTSDDAKPSQEDQAGWNFKPGTYTPKQVIEQVAPLLESLLVQLGADPPGTTPARKLLVDGLSACLSTSSRESALPLPQNTTDPARKEMAMQASRVTQLLLQYVEGASPKGADPHIVIRSPCEGHLWTHPVASLLMGPRSNGVLMQVYNEWLHQVILLRDALIPFENFAELQLCLKANSSKGTRPMEAVRSQFLSELMTRQIKRTTILDVAKALTAPNLPSGGYGFQYQNGLVMPAALLTGTSSVLLRYIPATLDDRGNKEVLFESEYNDYYSVPRVEIGWSAKYVSSTWPRALDDDPLAPKLIDSHLTVEDAAGKPSSVCLLKLQGTFEDKSSFSIDVGQITRGLRYAYRVHANQAADEEKLIDIPATKACKLHKPSEVLAQSNLVSSQDDGVHVIHATSSIVRLALLGKLYPENIVLLDDDKTSSRALSAGKGFGPKFIVVGGKIVAN
jgi:hypothetical protein